MGLRHRQHCLGVIVCGLVHYSYTSYVIVYVLCLRLHVQRLDKNMMKQSTMHKSQIQALLTVRSVSTCERPWWRQACLRQERITFVRHDGVREDVFAHICVAVGRFCRSEPVKYKNFLKKTRPNAFSRKNRCSLQRKSHHVAESRVAVLAVVQHRHAQVVLGQISPLVCPDLKPAWRKRYGMKESVCRRHINQKEMLLCRFPGRVLMCRPVNVSQLYFVRCSGCANVPRKLDFQELVAFVPAHLQRPKERENTTKKIKKNPDKQPNRRLVVYCNVPRRTFCRKQSFLLSSKHTVAVQHVHTHMEVRSLQVSVSRLLVAPGFNLDGW